MPRIASILVLVSASLFGSAGCTDVSDDEPSSVGADEQALTTPSHTVTLNRSQPTPKSLTPNRSSCRRFVALSSLPPTP